MLTPDETTAERTTAVLDRVGRAGWQVRDEDGTVLYGPTWSMTALVRWATAENVYLRGGVPSCEYAPVLV